MHRTTCRNFGSAHRNQLADPESNSWPLAEAVRERQVLVVSDIQHRLGVFTSGPYPEAPHTALVLPINLSGLDQPFGVLVAGVSARRELDESYHTFYLMLRESVTNTLTNARAYEQERKRAEALAEIDRAKTAFFSNVSHEFHPAHLMLGPLEDTLAEGRLSALARERLTVAYRNSQRLLKMVNSLLDFSRIEAGRIQATYEPVDLASFTSSLASVFRSAIRAGRHEAGCRLPAPLPAGVR